MKKPKLNISLQEVLSGSIFTRKWFREQYKLVLLIAAWMFVYMYNGFQCQRQERQIAQLQKQIKDAHYELLDLSAEYTEMTRPSTLNRLLREQDSKVTESVVPPIVIEK